MNYQALFAEIQKKKSFLCVGLDSDVKKIPQHLLSLENPLLEFNKQIADATADVAVAYKFNTAFYEYTGSAGWETLKKTVCYIKKKYPTIFLIADAKRGDIGNTSRMYAGAFLENMPFDAITVNPYMGEDSVKPFLEHKEKWVILLALTSNKGAQDFQFIREGETRLFEKVLEKSKAWGNPSNMMYVVGATKADMLSTIRKIVPDHFLLVPGIGAQGGNLQEVARYGMNSHCGLLVNSSRGIIYADSTGHFAEAAGRKSLTLRNEMEKLLQEHGVL